MQKKIIALAIAAAFSAPAFADVNMYGVVDAAVARASADGQKSDLLAVSGGLSQSRIGAKAAEDLSNGMKAVVNIEYGLDTQSNTAIGSGGVGNTNVIARQQMLALAGGFGTVATGYLQTTGYDFAVKFDPTADSLVSPLQSMTGANGFLIGSAAGAARAQRALAYISPNMSGFTVAVNYATALAGVGNLTVASNLADVKTSATLASVNYDWNALSVGGVYAKTSAPTATPSTTDYALGASYDLSVVKLFGTYQQTKTDAAGVAGTANKAMSFSALAPVGPGSVLFSYAKSTLGTVTSQNGSGYTVGWLQGLSKMTTAYATVTKVSNGSAGTQYSVINNALAGGAMTAGGSSTLFAVGLNKKF
ncbi:outer membrane porin protein 32 precursor [mine drainage metagenome]|uniref:Outer membrane porin protein 32 n=2 Tax=root TaxID=1 RepID=A0AAN2BZT4_9PROT|nr:porin [Sideroxyarcus emersonii]BCK88401.1 outer membrane porin protein 32 [Sideroxyarcus emersonii]